MTPDIRQRETGPGKRPFELQHSRNRSEVMATGSFHKAHRSPENFTVKKQHYFKKADAGGSQQNSPSFQVKSLVETQPRVISERMIDQNISKNIRANLKPVKKALAKEASPGKSHKYSKTFTHIDEIPGVFTFINNQVSADCSHKERSLSPHSGGLNSAKSED